MKTNNYIMREKVVGEDKWLIHYLRLNEDLVRITCDLLRPNRKFWQSKVKYSDWTYCGYESVHMFEAFADDIINQYYLKANKKKKLDAFFEEN